MTALLCGQFLHSLADGCKTILSWTFDTQNCGPVDITFTHSSLNQLHILFSEATPIVLRVSGSGFCCG